MPALAVSKEHLIAQFNSHAQLAASHRLEAWKTSGNQAQHIRADPAIDADSAEKRLARAARFASEPQDGFIAAPSRGIGDGQADLRESAVQQKLSDRIDGLINIFAERYEADYCAEWTSGSKPQTEMLDILREMRKLREGIIASGRNDDFAISAFEKSVMHAIRCSSGGHIGSALPYLVSILHPTLAQRHLSELSRAETEVARLEKRQAEAVEELRNGFKELNVHATSPVQLLAKAKTRVQAARERVADTQQRREHFASLLLLSHVASSAPAAKARTPDGPSGPDFMQTYRNVTCPVIRTLSLDGKLMPDRRPSVYDDASFTPLPASSPRLIFARRVYRAYLDSNWPLLRKILEAGATEDVTESQCLLVRSLVEPVRNAVWAQASVVYNKMDLDALMDRLLLNGWWSDGVEGREGTDELDSFLRSKHWASAAVKDDRRVLLRLAPRDATNGIVRPNGHINR